MNTKTNQTLLYYTYINNVIDFYAKEYYNNKKKIITLKDIVTHFKDIESVLNNWAKIDINEFILLLNTIHKNGLIKYIQQEDLFGKKVNDEQDYLPSVELNFFSTETVKKSFEGLVIYFNIYNTIYGKALIASISDYICYLHFIEDETIEIENFKNEFKKADKIKKSKNVHLEAIEKINFPLNENQIQVILNASPFQEKVYHHLVRLPLKKIKTYSSLAEKINSKNSSRAVGQALSKNPIAILIPCHRVIQTNGNISEYIWGTNRKKAIILFEILGSKV